MHFIVSPSQPLEKKSSINISFLFGDVKLHKFYFLLLDNLPKIVLMFKKPEGGI